MKEKDPIQNTHIRLIQKNRVQSKTTSEEKSIQKHQTSESDSKRPVQQTHRDINENFTNGQINTMKPVPLIVIEKPTEKHKLERKRSNPKQSYSIYSKDLVQTKTTSDEIGQEKEDINNNKGKDLITNNGKTERLQKAFLTIPNNKKLLSRSLSEERCLAVLQINTPKHSVCRRSLSDSNVLKCTKQISLDLNTDEIECWKKSIRFRKRRNAICEFNRSEIDAIVFAIKVQMRRKHMQEFVL